ncbi:MAG: hypothetical protein VX982_06530, partial [Chloroflexota bacterium]|nr:hypothetical protein [Chloroflexota bacterium]
IPPPTTYTASTEDSVDAFNTLLKRAMVKSSLLGPSRTLISLDLPSDGTFIGIRIENLST